MENFKTPKMSPEKNHIQRKLKLEKEKNSNAPEYHGHRGGLPYLNKTIFMQFFISKRPDSFKKKKNAIY